MTFCQSGLPSFRRRWLAAITAGVCAAAGAPAVSAADYRGFASAGPLGVLLFQQCNGKAAAARLVKLEDDTPQAALTAGIDDVRKIMLNSGRPLYVEFDGGVVGANLRARRFLRAIGTVDSCATAPAERAAGTRLWAAGAEPPWQLVVTATGARFERPGEAPVRLPAAAFAAAAKNGATQVFDAWSALDGGSIRLELTPQMCSDGRSETAYGAQAVLRYGNRTYEGCAARF
jgi:uncharacterized membrane protein